MFFYMAWPFVLKERNTVEKKDIVLPEKKEIPTYMWLTVFSEKHRLLVNEAVFLSDYPDPVSNKFSMSLKDSALHQQDFYFPPPPRCSSHPLLPPSLEL